MSLSGKQRRHLRGLGHHLDPVIHVGKEGLSEGLLSAARTALLDHELIKVRLGEGAGGDRDSLGATLAARLGAELAGGMGHTLLLYKRHPDKPRIALPGQRAPKPSAGGAPRAPSKRR